MFLNHYDHSIDEKGRITIPAKYRDQLQGGAFLTKGFDQNLTIYPSARFQAFLDRLNHMNSMDPAIRQLKRWFLANAAEIEFDRAGRFIIPQNLRDEAGLNGAAVVVGIGEEIEIWSPSNWKAQNDMVSEPDFKEKQFASLDLSI
ncbi:MAG TPA: division/cell wall cluster transcriptional repressor MraZ [Anaerolineaceae bacterium]|jgi:MraZ protein|nr:division/cell wall cluster transcriptional repressor MraZ [Anaerolineaceae bacterium]